MNPSEDDRDEPSSEGESSRDHRVLDEQKVVCSSPSQECYQDSMKRAAARHLIEQYFYQLTEGCGSPNCHNRDCASNKETRKLPPNEAAAEAIRLFYKDAKLCDRQNSLPSKVRRTASSSAPTDSTNSEKSKTTTCVGKDIADEVDQNQVLSPSTESSLPCNNECLPLTEERLCELCKECLETQAPQLLVRALGGALAQPTVLARCFPVKLEENGGSSKENYNKLGSKELHSITSTSDPDKDIDCIIPALDVDSCRRAFRCLAQLPLHYYESTLLTALTILAEYLTLDLRVTKQLSTDDVVNCFVIAFETPVFVGGDNADAALVDLCRAASHLPVHAQAKLTRTWALHCRESLANLLVCLQQSITLRVVSADYDFGAYVQDDEVVVMATKVMKIVYYASILAGEMECNVRKEAPVVLPSDPLGDAFLHIYKQYSHKGEEDPLGKELDVCALDSRQPLIPFEDFYNEPLCDHIEMDRDFSLYKSDISSTHKPFAFLHYPFVLTVATKALGLYYDNRIRMHSEGRASLMHAVVGSSDPVPYLRLKVRRSHIIDDALVELEVIAMERAVDLKKQLVVEFEGEQGVDEGGVSKEFFQLVVEEIFNPDYGMFTTQPDSHTVWFNPTSFETDAQFTLIGIVLGLAIYNNVILALNFPMVLYRKLLGRKGNFRDLADWNPVLYRSLRSMLEYGGEDMEEVFVQTFRICYQDVFGNPIFHELKPDGDSLLVNQQNKQEFVELYSDLLLNKSVETQFGAFRRGFAMVTGESPLLDLFRPEELETLVCGSKKLDFNELEKWTEYEGGFTSESRVIRQFWSIVHGLTTEHKRKLLQFTTGSDRVPVGGLAHLKLVIARNGPDSDRLPTAHTCFNVLLLPEYSTRDKLNNRLMKAISYSKGFGML